MCWEWDTLPGVMFEALNEWILVPNASACLVTCKGFVTHREMYFDPCLFKDLVDFMIAKPSWLHPCPQPPISGIITCHDGVNLDESKTNPKSILILVFTPRCFSMILQMSFARDPRRLCSEHQSSWPLLSSLPHERPPLLKIWSMCSRLFLCVVSRYCSLFSRFLMSVLRSVVSAVNLLSTSAVGLNTNLLSCE